MSNPIVMPVEEHNKEMIEADTRFRRLLMTLIMVVIVGFITLAVYAESRRDWRDKACAYASMAYPTPTERVRFYETEPYCAERAGRK